MPSELRCKLRACVRVPARARGYSELCMFRGEAAGHELLHLCSKDFTEWREAAGAQSTCESTVQPGRDAKKLLDNFYERQVHVRSYFELRVVAGPKCARKLKTKFTRSCAEPGGSIRNYFSGGGMQRIYSERRGAAGAQSTCESTVRRIYYAVPCDSQGRLAFIPSRGRGTIQSGANVLAQHTS